MINRQIPNLLVADVAASAAFYRDVIGMEPRFESDWYVQLGAAGGPGIELGLHRSDHELIPEAFRNQAPSGQYLTFVVQDVTAVHERAQAAGVPVIQAPKSEFYGQIRMLLTGPDGELVDVSMLDPDFGK